MNKCLNCGEPVKNKYCNTSCQNSHQNSKRNSDRANKKFGQYRQFLVTCNKCDVEFEVIEREKRFPKKDKYYCSRRCANSRIWSDDDKLKKSIPLRNRFRVERINSKCLYCGDSFEHRISVNRKFCSIKCSNTFLNKNNKEKARKGGRKSAQVQAENRRSKNEIHFANLCKDHFKSVRTNEAIFKGWDADVIIDDIKVAILWNGKWHYEKITEKHSVKQVQNRDKIKIKEIKEFGYTPYIIKDMGKENIKFVNEEFEKFINEKY